MYFFGVRGGWLIWSHCWNQTYTHARITQMQLRIISYLIVPSFPSWLRVDCRTFASIMYLETFLVLGLGLGSSQGRRLPGCTTRGPTCVSEHRDRALDPECDQHPVGSRKWGWERSMEPTDFSGPRTEPASVELRSKRASGSWATVAPKYSNATFWKKQEPQAAFTMETDLETEREPDQSQKVTSSLPRFCLF